MTLISTFEHVQCLRSAKAHNSADSLWNYKLRSDIFFSREHSAPECKSFQVPRVNSMVTCFYNWLIPAVKEIWPGFYNHFKKQAHVVGTGIVLFSQRYIKKIKRVRRMILVVSVQNQAWLNLKRIQNITDRSLCVVRVPACSLFVCRYFASMFLSMRGQQLVKCYQVDEKLQQIPFIISWKRKLTKWNGMEGN